MSGRRKAFALGVALGAAAGAAVEAGRRTSSTPAVSSPIRHRDGWARKARLARVGAVGGADWAVTRARRVFASAAHGEVLAEEYQLRTAGQVAEELGHMKGALMKLGQMASYLDQGLPEPVREALAGLQQDAPGMTPELAAAAVVEALGVGPDELFEEWDDHPIAAASIGQVHRAITRDGRPVAVKVQYPGVAEAVGADLADMGLVFGAVGQVFDGLETDALVAELKQRLAEELDYEQEAENQRLFADFYADHPFIHVPSVVDELSTARVLTTELSAGVRFDEMLTWDQAERDAAAETIFRFVFGSLYRMHTFNADPHPGNYLFEPGGHVTFLDFGLVKRFTVGEVGQFDALVQTMVLGRDPAAFRRAAQDAGLIGADPAASDEEIADWFAHFYEFVLEDAELTITAEYASDTVRQMFDVTDDHGDLIRSANVPPAFALTQRINLGLYAVLGQIGARRNWRRIADELWPFVAGPPSTPMGEAEAAWRRTHHG